MNIPEIKKEVLDICLTKEPQNKERINSEVDFLVMHTFRGKNVLEDIYFKSKNCKKIGTINNVNSLIAYLLGLTSKYPNLKNPICFEKKIFARASLPDVDCDIEYARKEEFIQSFMSLYEFPNENNDKYSRRVGTYNSLKLKSVITSVCKALDIAGSFNKGKERFVTDNLAMVREIIDQIPAPKGAKLKGIHYQTGKEIEVKSIQDAYDCFENFRFYMDKYPEIMIHAKNIEGQTSSFGVHASAVLTSSYPLNKLAPQKRSTKGMATIFTGSEVESLGLIKFDWLALAHISVIKQTVSLIKENYGINIDIENLPINDQKTFDLYNSGKLTGVFQCEQSGMQQAIMNIGISDIRHIFSAISLYRPGGMSALPRFCSLKNKTGEYEADYFHPKIKELIEPILSPNYGCLIYQEDIMNIVQVLANFDVVESYEVIKGIGKKQYDLINKYKQKFIDGAFLNGIPKDIAEKYWEEQIVPFADYAFNLAHAAAYGYESYKSAYLKANYTEEFIVSLINVYNLMKKHDDVEIFERDLRNFNIELGPKSFNTCGVEYRIIKKKDPSVGIHKSVISPSIMVKGMGKEVAEEFVKNAPYKDFVDIVNRTNSSLVDKGTIESLSDAGFFDLYIKHHNKLNKTKLTSKDLIPLFESLKSDKKKSENKGIVSQNIFDLV
jgi:DNA polymerase-3 subunit alpha